MGRGVVLAPLSSYRGAGVQRCAYLRSSDGPAEDIEGAYKQLIDRAHARGLKIFGGTITPYEDAQYYHPEGETVRLAVNQWIRTSGAFDGVIDFEKAVRDPRHPARYLGADQSGDNLHPNDAGYRAMWAAIDLNFFKSP
jgi:lysophospholipase L1-like esterase